MHKRNDRLRDIFFPVDIIECPYFWYKIVPAVFLTVPALLKIFRMQEKPAYSSFFIFQISQKLRIISTQK